MQTSIELKQLEDNLNDLTSKLSSLQGQWN